jgi:ElaA protein
MLRSFKINEVDLMTDFKWYKFSELNIDQLYAILVLRSEIFVVEQQCTYLDPDGKDDIALHLLGVENNSLEAYLRLFPPTTSQKNIFFGRVLTAPSARSKGLGKKLISELLKYCENHFQGVTIECSAQLYLKKFYESFGFEVVGEPYDDVGIQHISMRKYQ